MVGPIDGAVEKGKRLAGEADDEKEESQEESEQREDAREPETAGVG
jgi:hypothetical protein